MGIADSIKRAPRWAWITAGGVGLGAAAIKLWNDRDAPATEDDPAAVVDEAAGGGYQYGAGGASGVIVPPVIVAPPENDANMGVGVLQDLYVSAVGQLVSGWENIWGPVQTAQLSLITDTLPNMIDNLANAGSAPSREPTPVVVHFPEPQPQPQPVAPPPPAPPPPVGPPPCPPAFPHRSARGCYRVEVERRQRDNGQSGANRKVWCNNVFIHRYSDGSGVVVREDKIKDGAC